MKILLVGAGGVGAAFAAIAARRDFFAQIVIADYDPARAEKAAAQDGRYVAAQVDASSQESVAALCREHELGGGGFKGRGALGERLDAPSCGRVSEKHG